MSNHFISGAINEQNKLYEFPEFATKKINIYVQYVMNMSYFEKVKLGLIIFHIIRIANVAFMKNHTCMNHNSTKMQKKD